MEYPQRKRMRLKGYDYNTVGAYHVTICTKNKLCILSDIVGQAAPCLPQIRLTNIGIIIQKYIERIPVIYGGVVVDKYVIMPNHIHLLLRIEKIGAQRAARPTVSAIVRSLKVMVRKETGESLFQSSYYDHIIRGKADYDETWIYIENNPVRWLCREER